MSMTTRAEDPFTGIESALELARAAVEDAAAVPAGTDVALSTDDADATKSRLQAVHSASAHGVRAAETQIEAAKAEIARNSENLFPGSDFGRGFGRSSPHLYI